MIALRACPTAAALLLVWTAAAHAQTPNPAAAQELFTQGRQALDAGDFKTACARLGESNRLERRVGTLISLATCEHKLGRPATALAHWRDARDLAIAGSDPRAAYVSTKIAELEPEVPKLVIVPPSEKGVVVRFDGVEIGASSLGVQLPADPGKHRIVASASGKVDASVEIEVPARGTTVTARIPALADAPVPPPAAVEGGAPAKPPTGIRTAGWISLGTGAAAVGVATVTGIILLDKKATVRDHCDATARVCDPEGLSASASGSSLLPVNAIAWIVGGAGVAAGVVLLLVVPSKDTTSAAGAPSLSLGFTPGGVRAQGSF